MENEEYIQEELRSRMQAFLPNLLEEARNMGGNVTQFLNQKLNELRDVPLSCAVIGRTGTGKSSFINTMRGLSADDTGAAQVDVTETTMEPTPYPDPINNLVQYWDLPGVGSSEYPRDSYLEMIVFQRYDFFIILSATRFTEDDMWLATQIRQANKKFFFVRSKIDQDIENQRRSRPSSFCFEETISKIKTKCYEGLQHSDDCCVFLISNFYPNHFHFPSLRSNLINSLPELKREVMALSIPFYNDEAMKVFWKRAFYASLAGSAVEYQPPGCKVVMEQAAFYEKHFHCYFRSAGLESNSTEICQQLSSITQLCVDGVLQPMQSTMSDPIVVTKDELNKVKELGFGTMNEVRFQAAYCYFGRILLRSETIFRQAVAIEDRPAE